VLHFCILILELHVLIVLDIKLLAFTRPVQSMASYNGIAMSEWTLKVGILHYAPLTEEGDSRRNYLPPPGKFMFLSTYVQPWLIHTVGHGRVLCDSPIDNQH
jgi:hypothetical protein